MTQQTFSSKVTLHHLVRTYLLLANLTSAKKEDGIARLLLETDVSRVAGKAKESMCVDAEMHSTQP